METIRLVTRSPCTEEQKTGFYGGGSGFFDGGFYGSGGASEGKLEPIIEVGLNGGYNLMPFNRLMEAGDDDGPSG